MSAGGERPATVHDEEAALGSAWHRWTRGLGFAFVALAVLALLALLAFGLLNKGESGSGLVDKEAPDFTLNLFDGGTFTLSENRGQPVVMNIWASWCESCQAEAEDMEQAWSFYRDRGVIFVGVNVMDSRDDAEKFLSDFGITYPNGPDESDIYFKYRATGTPETFFIDRDGKIAVKYLGPLTAEQVFAFTEELLR
jgi:cytochrome c biogenesis protein CcmG/thiol:disulfide interchange protein DsbE